MKIETLKQKGKIITGIVITIILVSTVIFYNISLKEKHTLKRSTNDQLMAVYLEDGSGTYTKASDGKIPTSGYTLNTDTDKTRCTVNGEVDSRVNITYENGEIKVSKVTKPGTRCYFYFDKIKGISTDEVIADGKPTDDSMFSGTSGNGIYTWTKGDYSGGAQPIKYFRGNVNNNWVVFGKDGSNYIWWRIIRNNSNGSLRMIYAGVSSSKTSAPATTGTGTQIGTNAFNRNYGNNMYAGFKYTSGEVHGTGTPSTILGVDNSTDKTTLYGWYNTVLKTDYASYIDMDAGFCNNRQPSTDRNSLNGSGGKGTTETYYGAWMRLIMSKTPNLLCPESKDIFKTPIGLITADETSMGGMVYSSPANTNSYLYTNTNYWTMSPCNTNIYGYVNMFHVGYSGYITDAGVYTATTGVRPVINLKADTLFEEGGTGEASTPFVVKGT